MASCKNLDVATVAEVRECAEGKAGREAGRREGGRGGKKGKGERRASNQVTLLFPCTIIMIILIQFFPF